MLKTPKHGWSQITIGTWTDRCSYLDDVPNMLLRAVDAANRTRTPSCAKFDAEGWEYAIIFDRFSTHIITLDFYGNWQHTDIDIYLVDLIKELIADIRQDIDGWSEWGFDMNEDEISERKKDLLSLCRAVEDRL